MPGQPRPITEILTERLALVARIAAANAEHLRLLQLSGGAQILRMMRDDAETDAEAEAEIAAEAEALALSLVALDALEADLDRLDRECAAAAAGKDLE